MLKLSRILGIIGCALTMLPYVVFIGHCIYTLILPDSAVHFESKGYASAFLILFIVPAVISASGLIGAFLVGKRPLIAGFIMIASCGHNFISPMMSIFSAPAISVVIKVVAALLLVAAGVLALISYKVTSVSRQPQSPDSASG